MLCFRKKSRVASASALQHTGLGGSAQVADMLAIVIDSGSGSTRAGFAGDEGPRTVFPTLVGEPKFKGVFGIGSADYFVGNDAAEKRGILRLSYPVNGGIIDSWEDMVRIWDHTFVNELRTLSHEHPVLLTEPPLNPRVNREKIAEIMFGTFQVPKLALHVDAELALRAVGKSTGVVVQLNDDTTHAVPIIDGRYLPFATLPLDVTGKDLTVYLTKLLAERKVILRTSAELDVADQIKETLCYVVLDFAEEIKKAQQGLVKDAKYEMPDGNSVSLGSECFRCPEALFQPSLLGKESKGLHELTYQAIMTCGSKPPFMPRMGCKDFEDRRAYDAIPACSKAKTTSDSLLANVVLAGDTKAFSGLSDRLEQELKKLAPQASQSSVKVMPPKDTKYLAWIGGSMWASAQQPTWITKEQYDECGPNIVHRDCKVPLLEGDFPSRAEYLDYVHTLSGDDFHSAAEEQAFFCAVFPGLSSCPKQA